MRQTHMRTLAARLAAALALTALPWTSTVQAHPLTDKAKVRMQSDQLTAGWHEGTVQVQANGCALVWVTNPQVPGGRTGLALTFVRRLQRWQGHGWVDVPLPSLMALEPGTCKEGNG